ncbi:MAG: hypothetical protein A2287_06115 [Candidatus Melainabacteria bacterium RIFOXYA12_FULL_32_12]|nr:MAG: hypothetical protein A2255_03515 [Candidatus Melainabacteria bacterium RIFOXYA2_FULL_32_9]OGI27777.1 MAG: hypothetical protein A2287_06115 [Candidatus Melainabacteria bacterium RIFOXYA12_FULL_32_12]
MIKKLSVAFIWHMHQPVYTNTLTGEYLMPWVRLHAIKDYLDMLLILEEFPNIKQTFNLVPSLIDQLYDYGHNNAHDSHSRLTVTDIAKLSSEDKEFILKHFFDANYANMISPYEPYRKLYEKRYQNDQVTVDNFSDQEYSDILAWFNLAWFDPYWRTKVSELDNLYNKGCDYTLEDRKLIIELQRRIIKDIVPKYKEFLQKGQIEISTSPYYHPIIPLVVDSGCAKRSSHDIQLPASSFEYADDVKVQIKSGINKFKEIFGVAPSGIWPSEHCVSPETLELLSDLGVKWIISDEGNLAKTLGKEFVRDFYGNLQDPYDLCQAYQADINDKKIFTLFRNSVFADLIGFEYGDQDSEIAANDLYERIKTIQAKLQATPEENHIVTIAMDGENSWESYKEDGGLFLRNLYKLLSEDETLDITTVSNFLERANKPKTLNTIHSGSWINRNFNLWIGDPTKNIAWDYLHQTREDLVNFIKENKYSKEVINKAWKEIYIAEGSDWFWWYGEPNDSGHDDMFDLLFRVHLKNVYKILDEPVPDYLDIPLDLFAGTPSRCPDGIFRPSINGMIDSDDEWAKAGHIELPQGPMYQSDRLLRRIFFGYDSDNIYFRFDINQDRILNLTNEIYIYFYMLDRFGLLSPLRVRNKGNAIFPTQRYTYAYELEIPVCQGKVFSPVLSEAMEGSLWKIKSLHGVGYNYKSVLELSVPFADLDLPKGNEVHFIVVTSKAQILQEIIPQNKLLSIVRPDCI